MVGAVGNRIDACAHLLFRAHLQFVDALFDDIFAIAVDQCRQASLTDGKRGRLRLDIANALIRDANIGQDDRQDLFVHHSAFE